MYIEHVNIDVSNICFSYLSEDEHLYINKKWDQFDKKKLLEIASENGWIDLLKWALDNEYIIWNDVIYLHIIQSGQLKLLKWIWVYKEPHLYTKQCLCVHATKNNNLEILKWLHLQGCEISLWTYACAARKGNLEILKWLDEQNCPWDERAYSFAFEEKQLAAMEYISKKEIYKMFDKFKNFNIKI